MLGIKAGVFPMLNKHTWTELQQFLLLMPFFFNNGKQKMEEQNTSWVLFSFLFCNTYVHPVHSVHGQKHKY